MERQKLIDDTIQVTSVNKDGKFFEKGMFLFYFNSFMSLVSRIVAKSEVCKFDIELDVNTDIYPMEN